jgi:hypothetical protein
LWASQGVACACCSKVVPPCPACTVLHGKGRIKRLGVGRGREGCRAGEPNPVSNIAQPAGASLCSSAAQHHAQSWHGNVWVSSEAASLVEVWVNLPCLSVGGQGTPWMLGPLQWWWCMYGCMETACPMQAVTSVRPCVWCSSPFLFTATRGVRVGCTNFAVPAPPQVPCTAAVLVSGGDWRATGSMQPRVGQPFPCEFL